MLDDKLTQNGAKGAADLEVLKSDPVFEVSDEKAERSRQNHIRRVENMQQRFVPEIATTQKELELGRTFARISQVIDYIFFIIYGLLGIRLIFALFASRTGADFVQFIYSLTDPFYAPFRGIVSTLPVEGYTLALPIIIALITYVLIHLAINTLLRIIVYQTTAI